jgi:hypothetical protein
MPKILEQISGLCDSGTRPTLRTNRQLYSIKKIAGRNPVLRVIGPVDNSYAGFCEDNVENDGLSTLFRKLRFQRFETM